VIEVELYDAPALCGAADRQARRVNKVRYATGAIWPKRGVSPSAAKRACVCAIAIWNGRGCVLCPLCALWLSVLMHLKR